MYRPIASFLALAAAVLMSSCIPTGSGDKGSGEACTATEECIPGHACFNGFCVGEGSLRISLSFTTDADFDLHVLTPNASEIYYGNRDADGGTLDVDQCVSSCGSEAHVENVYWTDAAPSGVYEVWVVNYGGRAEGSFTIEVAGGTSQNYSGSLAAVSGEESTRFTFSL